MADNTTQNTGRDDLALQHDTDIDDTEPATSHDVTEGGAIGLVGGAVVGGLAGGPVGAIIGAVAGGLASAGAVDVVDKHDHDYNRTVSGSTTPATTPGAYAGTGTDDYDTDYRTDYQTRYANSGAAYDTYQPAYHYGRDLAADPRYQAGDWNTVETGARTDWETRNPGEGSWDRFKDSVRYAWDSARNKMGSHNTGNTSVNNDSTLADDGTTVYTSNTNNNRF